MSMHLRRLHADFAALTAGLANHPYIALIAAEGNPPEKYTFAFTIPGLSVGVDHKPVVVHEHKAEVFLPLDYPRRQPFCRMITPVFHPNIDPQKICIGDHWSAGQSLAVLVAMIGEMICYQSYNVKSPLNAAAAVWVQAHEGQVPLQKGDVRLGLCA